MNAATRRTIIALLLATAAGLGRPAAGQEQRIRTLEYDPTKDEWVEVPPPQSGTPEGDLHRIRTDIKNGRYQQAHADLRSFEEAYGTEHLLYPAAMIAQAEALVGQKDYDDAHEILQLFLNQYSGMEGTADALRLEHVIAEAYLAGAKRRIWGLPLFSGVETALKILDEISIDYQDYRIAELALLTKADYLFSVGDYALAEAEYARFLRQYPRSRYERWAWQRSAASALASFAGVEYDAAPLIEAQERYREYYQRFPADAKQEGIGLVLDSIQEARAESQYNVGRYYERTGHVSSAVFYYRLVRDEWPDTIAATRAADRLAILGAASGTDMTDRNQG